MDLKINKAKTHLKAVVFRLREKMLYWRNLPNPNFLDEKSIFRVEKSTRVFHFGCI